MNKHSFLIVATISLIITNASTLAADYMIDFSGQFGPTVANFNYDPATGNFSDFTIDWIVDNATFRYDFTDVANNPMVVGVPACASGLSGGYATFNCFINNPTTSGGFERWISNQFDFAQGDSGFVYDDLALITFSPVGGGYLDLESGRLMGTCDPATRCQSIFLSYIPNGSFAVEPATGSTVPEPSTWLLFTTGMLGLLGFASPRRMR